MLTIYRRGARSFPQSRERSQNNGEHGEEAVRRDRRRGFRGYAGRFRCRGRLSGLQIAKESQRREGVPRGRTEDVDLSHKHVAHRQVSLCWPNLYY